MLVFSTTGGYIGWGVLLAVRERGVGGRGVDFLSYCDIIKS